MATDQLPELAALNARFAPDPQRLPLVLVELAPLSAYVSLLESGPQPTLGLGEAA